MTMKKTGILLSNLGTPEQATVSAVRRYLREFLSDPRVVEIPKPLWWLILNLAILPFRPRKSAEAYQTIWQPDGSPLLLNCLKQQHALQDYLNTHFPSQYHVTLGMRYGKPSMKSALQTLQQAGCEQIIALPLYPQYAAATSASSFDAISVHFRTQREITSLNFIRDYHDHPAYIRALANSVKQHWQQHGQQQLLLFSFHGLPKRCVDQGDPYQHQCLKTAELLAQALQLKPHDWSVTFQSRLGKAEWLKPYTDITLRALPEQGTTSVDVMCPGFSADCLETLEEIAIANKEEFLTAGGKTFHYIPCLNDTAQHIEMLAEICLNQASMQSGAS